MELGRNGVKIGNPVARCVFGRIKQKMILGHIMTKTEISVASPEGRLIVTAAT